MSRSIRFLLIPLLPYLITSLLPTLASAQVTTGTPPFGSFSGGPEVVNSASLNAHWTIPVLHKPGRGTNFTYVLNYDSSVWYPAGATWMPVANWGWRGATEGLTGYITHSTSSHRCLVETQWEYWYIYSNWIYHDSFGVPHRFNISVTTTAADCGINGTEQAATATDGSGYNMDVVGDGGPSATLYSSIGTLINAPMQSPLGAGNFTDRNGNVISTDGNGHFYDTMSSTTAVLTVSGTAPNPVSFTYTAPSGASPNVKLVYAAYTVQTNFGCSGITDYPATSTSLVSEIDLPDGSKYLFDYENTPGDTHSPHYRTGRLAKVTLPTGGTITYTYTGGSSGNITCADGSTPGLTRVLSDGASWSATWNYTRTAGTGSAYATRITDPLNNDTIIQFQGIFETQRDTYSGTGPTFTSVPITESTLQTPALLEELQTCYNGSAAPCTGTAITAQITSRKMITILAGGLQSEHDDTWNTYGGPTEADDYDYGAAPHGPLLKKVLATYATLGNITAFRQQVTIQNAGGFTVAQTNYNYDETTPTTTSGIPQHVSVSGPRGNLTSVNNYTASGTFLTRKSSYYDTGMLSTTTDVNNGLTTYNYTAGTASCYNTFPTSITEPISGLSTSATWNCTGGVQLTAIDENNQTTTTTYSDPYYWRRASVTDPTGAVTNFCYGLVTSGTCNINPNQTESYLTFNSNNSTVDNLTTVDGLGRVRTRQTRQGPSATNFDSIETDYDALGRPNRTTLPYSAGAGILNSTIAGTTTTFDPFYRPLTAC